MSSDSDARRALTRGFREYRGEPLTRADLAAMSGAPETWVTGIAEDLAKTGYIRKGKKGSRAVYSRGDEERAARPDLPDGWTYVVHIWHPAGVRREDVHIETHHWLYQGHAQYFEPRVVEGVHALAIVLAPWNPKLTALGVRGETKPDYDARRSWLVTQATSRGIALLEEAPMPPPGRYDPYPAPWRPPAKAPTGRTELVIWAPLADVPAAMKVADLGKDYSRKQYDQR